jgi:hydrogenase maturation protein HypF
MNPSSVSVLAFGAHLKNHSAWWDGQRLHRSTLHGDLGDVQACEALQSSTQHWVHTSQSQGLTPLVLAHDLHPDFYSSRCALEWAAQLDIPALGVQHHHAHLAAVACAHGLHGPVLGWALDGFGWGTDGTAWGGELLWVHGARWQRLAHLQTLALPGGDRAAREPWRLALACAHAQESLGQVHGIDLSGIAAVPLSRRQAVEQLLSRQLHCPRSSSAGRWFDAVAALLGVCLDQHDESQAPLALQALAEEGLKQAVLAEQEERTCWLRPDLEGHTPPARLPLGRLVQEVLELRQTQGLHAAALHFHWGLADGLARALIQWLGTFNATGAHVPVTHTVLSGGCFFNPVLRERMRWRLQGHGLSVHLLEPDGHGDSHLAGGQAWIAQDWWQRQRPAKRFSMAQCLPASVYFSQTELH